MNKGKFTLIDFFMTIIILIIIVAPIVLNIFKEKQKEGIIILEQAEIVYFDVVEGSICTKEEYESSWDGIDYSNSYTGYNGINGKKNQNSCLKFYKYMEDNINNTQTMILDHNTTGGEAWDSQEKYKFGPRELLKKLKLETKTWNGTLEPNNYVYNHSERSYTINYSGYKARLITANEVAQITGNDDWDELSKTSTWFYLDTLTTDPSSPCRDNDETTECKYGWLYDRTSTYCEEFGCLNNSDEKIYGYWTASAYSYNNRSAWFVYCFGDLYFDVVNFPYLYGVRPVITIPIA